VNQFMSNRTKNSIVTLLAVCTTFLMAVAAEARPPAPPAATVHAARQVAAGVAVACESLRRAMIGADARRMRALMSPRLSFGHSNGVVQTRSEFISAVVSRREVFKSIRLQKRRIRVTGSTAVVRQVFAADIDLAGKPLSVALQELQIWQRHAGKWQLLARQAFKA
jgi:hypothetical protein